MLGDSLSRGREWSTQMIEDSLQSGFGRRYMLRSDGAEDHEELVVNYTYVVEKGAYNALNVFDASIIEEQTVCYAVSGASWVFAP